MKAKKILVGLGLCSLLAFPATYVTAATCSNVQVLEAGGTAIGKVVKLKNMTGAQCGTNWAANAEVYFLLDTTSANANSMLAAALSAQATGSNVLVVNKSGDSFAQWSQIGTLYAKTTVTP